MDTLGTKKWAHCRELVGCVAQDAFDRRCMAINGLFLCTSLQDSSSKGMPAWNLAADTPSPQGLSRSDASKFGVVHSAQKVPKVYVTAAGRE